MQGGRFVVRLLAIVATAGCSAAAFPRAGAMVPEHVATSSLCQLPCVRHVYPTKHSPFAISKGPDGNLWFTQSYSTSKGQVGRMTTRGAITEFNIALPCIDITRGPDGNLWYTKGLLDQGSIGRITPAGTRTDFPLHHARTEPFGITSGADGDLWVTATSYTCGRFGCFPNRAVVIRMTTDGTTKPYPLPNKSSSPAGITQGAHGSMWFTESGAGEIGEITQDGTVVEYPISSPSSSPQGITYGSDGNIWFTESGADMIGRITPSGTVTEFPVPTAGAQPMGITSGGDGNVWFTEYAANQIGEITPSGVITEFPDPVAGSPYGITVGPNGNLWFTSANAPFVGEFVR